MTDIAPPPAESIAMEVLQQFRLIYGSMRQYFRLVEERCGIPGAQMWVLQEVQRNPGVGVGYLARQVGIHQSTCSLLVEKLVAAKMLRKERISGDRRRVGLHLATEGTRTLKRLPGPAEGILPEALSKLPEFALITLNANLNELIRHLWSKESSFAGTPLAELVSPESSGE